MCEKRLIVSVLLTKAISIDRVFVATYEKMSVVVRIEELLGIEEMADSHEDVSEVCESGIKERKIAAWEIPRTDIARIVRIRSLWKLRLRARK